MSDNEDNNDPKKKSALDRVRNALFKKPSVVNATSGDEEEKDGKTQKAKAEEKEESQEALPKIVAIKEEIEEEKEESQDEGGRPLPREWAQPDEPRSDVGTHREVESDRPSESKVLRLIPERLRGNDGILNVLEELLEYAAAGKLSYLTIAYGVDKGFGKVDSKAAWRVRDPGDHESARDIIFALEQLKYMCLKEWTEIERI